MNEEFDCCADCGCDDFRYDAQAYHSSCTNCGLVASFEVGYVEFEARRKTYYKHNYFTNTILTNAMNKGFKINRAEMVEMERLFKLCVGKFYETQEVHKRKYMISTSFTLMKIAEFMGKDVKPFITLPKRGTLSKLETLWTLINPL